MERTFVRAAIAYLLAGVLVAVASCDDDAGKARGDDGREPGRSPVAADPGDGIAGTPCSYRCSGPACNLRCEDGVIYRCPQAGSWILERDCAAQGQGCRMILIDGGPQGDVICVPAGDVLRCRHTAPKRKPGAHAKMRKTRPRLRARGAESCGGAPAPAGPFAHAGRAPEVQVGSPGARTKATRSSSSSAPT